MSDLTDRKLEEPIFGITTDTLPREDEEFLNLTNAIDAVKLPGNRKPVVRINIDADDKNDLEHYKNSVTKIKLHARVMVNLTDSHDMYRYKTVDEYRKMIRTYVNELSGLVDIWEIGNEVNGEWVGWKTDDDGNVIMDDGRKIPIAEMPEELLQPKRELVRDQIAGAYQEILDYEKLTETDLVTALTLYYNDDKGGRHCWEKPEYEMFGWAGKYLSDPIKKDLDYVFISFYEDERDCPILTKNNEKDTQTWVRIFKKISDGFGFDKPDKGRLGFGEFAPQCHDCEKSRSCSSCKRAKLEFIPRYYGTYHTGIIKAQVPKYIGGFFYWYFYQDMVSSDNKAPMTALKDAAKSFSPN